MYFSFWVNIAKIIHKWRLKTEMHKQRISVAFRFKYKTCAYWKKNQNIESEIWW